MNNFIGGKWIPSIDQKTFEIKNPANGEVIGKAQLSNIEDVKEAIDKTYELMLRTDWVFEPKKRSLALQKWSELISKEKQNLAKLLTMENGKPISQSLLEIESAIDHLRYYSGLARNIYGRAFSISSSNFSVIIREPMGMVAHIVPWNYPVTLLFRSLSAALAAGNICIIKPASYTPITIAKIIELSEHVEEIPKGVLTYITGPGSIVGTELVKNSKVDMIAFTGETSTGKQIMRLASENLKKLSLELGGKSPNIVFSDADMDKVMFNALTGAFVASGQVCFAGTRIIVEENVHQQFVEVFKQKAESMVVGNGLDPSTQIGPLISEAQLNKVLTYIEIGKNEGRLVTGGKRLTDGELEKGYFVSPTIFDNVEPKAKIAQDEIFGPVVTIHTFKDEKDAIEIANSTQYGLAAAIWTKSVTRALKLMREIKAGTIWVNSYGKTFSEAEFGGYKQSGIGRERGIQGLLEFTQLKHVYFEL